MARRKFIGKWANFNIAAPDGNVWSFWDAGDRFYVRYGKATGNKRISTGHWVGEPMTRLQAALAMNEEKEAWSKHAVVCMIVRNDMKNWKENRTKDKFRKIVRPRED